MYVNEIDRTDQVCIRENMLAQLHLPLYQNNCVIEIECFPGSRRIVRLAHPCYMLIFIVTIYLHILLSELLYVAPDVTTRERYYILSQDEGIPFFMLSY